MSKDPNTLTAGRNVKATLARFGFRSNDLTVRSLDRTHARVSAPYHGIDDPGRVRLERAYRCLTAAGISVTRQSEANERGTTLVYLVVEA